MKRRSFLTSIGALFSLPFLGKTAIPDEILSDCCDECERDDDEVESVRPCGCLPGEACSDCDSEAGLLEDSDVKWFRHCDQRKTCRQYNPWRRECRGEIPCILSYPHR